MGLKEALDSLIEGCLKLEKQWGVPLYYFEDRKLIRELNGQKEIIGELDV